MRDGDANGKTDGKTPAKTTGEVAADGTRETLNEIGGYGFRHDAKWRVEQQGPTTDPQYVAGTGDLARCTEELDLHTEPRVTPTRGANLGIFCPTLGC